MKELLQLYALKVLYFLFSSLIDFVVSRNNALVQTFPMKGQIVNILGNTAMRSLSWLLNSALIAQKLL